MHIIRKSDLLGSKAVYRSPVLQEERCTISTGCKNLDALLGGGIKTKEVTEFHGASLVGKTQLCHGLCAFASQYMPDYGVDGKVIFIDTEGTFRRERIREIAKKRGYDPNLALQNTVDLRAYSCKEQEYSLAKIEEQLSNRMPLYKLIIVDSVIANYKAEYSGRGNLSKRQQRLYSFMKNLHKIANTYNIAVVTTNHINEVPDVTEFNTTKPAGGLAMSYNTTHRIAMKSKPGRYMAHIYSSKFLSDPSIVRYSIGSEGIKDY